MAHDIARRAVDELRLVGYLDFASNNHREAVADIIAEHIAEATAAKDREIAELREESTRLRDELCQAQNTVEFMHGCLVEPTQYKYSYPDQAIKHLERWAKVAPRAPSCHHSVYQEGCEACDRHEEWTRRRRDTNTLLDRVEQVTKERDEARAEVDRLFHANLHGESVTEPSPAKGGE